MYAHNANYDVTQTFANSTLNKNWYEDRFQTSVAQTQGRTKQGQETKERVLAAGYINQSNTWQTTKSEFDQKALTSPPPANVKKPSMYTDSNLGDRLHAYGLADDLRYTVGLNAAAEAERKPERHLTTTNQLFYEQKPQQAMTASPETFASTKSPFGKTGALEKAKLGEASDQDNVAGGKGCRGEMTRRPGESGNPFGVGVFTDEYAKWGTKLQGMPLSESVAQKQTKYF